MARSDAPFVAPNSLTVRAYMPKKVDLTISISLPDGHGGGKLVIGQDGEIQMVNHEGEVINPTEIERTTHYERPKGKKVQSNLTAAEGSATISGLEELSTLDHFIVVDTNSIEIGGSKVSAAFFVVCKITRSHNGFTLTSLDNCGHVYEFHDVQTNPELQAIYRISNDTLKNKKPTKEKPIGFVTDTELSKHKDFMSGAEAIYGDNVLPPGFKLFYASSDTGQEVLNRLIRFCDRESSKYLKKLQENGIKSDSLMDLAEDRSIKYRYMYFPSLEISDSVITGASIDANTTATITYSG